MSNYVNLLDIVYPVGSIIASYSFVSPADYIGGTWETIEGMLYGSTSNIGKTGGSRTHSHALAGTGYARIGATGSDTKSIGYSPVSAPNMGSINAYTVFGTSSTLDSRNVNHWTNLAGSTNDTSTLPPYTNIYYYHRIA